MNISRRKFLAAVPFAVGAVLQLNGLASGQGLRKGLFRIPDDTSSDPLSRLTWDSFYQYINTDFSFGQGGNEVILKLTAMEDTKPAGVKLLLKGQECFVMKFNGPYRQPLTQGTYSVNHFALGDFKLFITEGGRLKRDKLYIAVINRLVS